MEEANEVEALDADNSPVPAFIYNDDCFTVNSELTDNESKVIQYCVSERK